MYKIKDKVAIIVGGGGGMGSVTAKALAEQGCKIAVVDLNEENGTAVAKEIGKAVDSDFFKCDISSVSDIEKTFNQIVERFGQADILVNAAGIPVREFIDEIDEKVWDRFVSINIKSAFFFAKLQSKCNQGFQLCRPPDTSRSTFCSRWGKVKGR